MREEFKPKKDELLRKAWKAEWDNLNDPKLTWEQFKRKKQLISEGRVFTSFAPKKDA